MKKPNHIIFLNGSINAGKSTVARALAALIGNAAIVEIDSLRAMIGWMPLDNSMPLNLKNALSVIRNFSADGMHVIVPYPLSQANYDRMIEGLKDVVANVSVFTLAPRLDIALTNRGARELRQEEVDRIRYHYKIGIHSPSFGESIDNSDLSPEETAGLIYSRLNICGVKTK